MIIKEQEEEKLKKKIVTGDGTIPIGGESDEKKDRKPTRTKQTRTTATTITTTTTTTTPTTTTATPTAMTTKTTTTRLKKQVSQNGPKTVRRRSGNDQKTI